MRTKLLIVVALFVLATVAAPAIYAYCTPWGNNCIDLVESYYSDSSFTNMVQFFEKDCDDNIFAWGSGGDWRIIETTGCATNVYAQHCEHWNGSSWDQVQCP